MRNGEGKAKSILIVDDNLINLDILFNYLDEAGFEVLVAEDGESALNRVKYVKPNIILLDVMMPGLDGFETCRRLQADPNTKDIPVIFMTARTDTEDKLAGFEVGAVDYVTKPLQYQEVVARLNTHLTIQNLRSDLQVQVEALQSRNKELDTFAYMIAHDLKNPLAVIMSYSQLIQRGSELSDKFQHYLNSIIETSQKMNKITDELLLLARIREEDVVLVPLDMTQIFQQSQQRLALMFETYQAELITPKEWPACVGHASWIEQVWVNLLSNGLKYGGHPPHLEVGVTSQAEGQVRFWVRDNGPGLTAAERSRLFTEFTRIKQAQAEGYGLGLAIVKRIIDKLGGQVGVESEMGQGSTFFFTLPRAET